MTALFFNLLANATFSLVTGLLVVGFFLWFFRIETNSWRVFLLSLPFIKIVYDTLRGVPANSVLLHGVDPFTLPPHHQILQVGTGFNTWGPLLHASFSVEDLHGATFAASVGDYFVIWLGRNFGERAPFAIVIVAGTIATALLAYRVWNFICFEVRRRNDRKAAIPFRQILGRRRSVDIYISKGFSGTPFTGGIFRPYICLPADSVARLAPAEMEAVISHELGHIRRWDLLATLGVQALGDIFWFVPGYRWLSRKVDRLREIVADEEAVQNGADRLALASALVQLKATAEKSDRFVLYSAFFREKSLLKIRVERLLSERTDSEGRWGWKYRPVRWLASFWIFMAVMMSTVGANHATAPLQNPEWFGKLLKLWGLA